MLRRTWVAAALAILLVAACAVTPTPTPSPSPTATTAPAATVARGGTLRVTVPVERAPSPSLIRATPPTPAVLDPQREFQDGLSILRCCLSRTLLAHNGMSSEAGGSRLHPDVAESLPELAADGVTWNIRLKRGLRYAPPLEDVEITAPDFVRSFHRLLDPQVFDLGAFFFGDIEGAAEYAEGQASSITGLEALDDHTLVIRLDHPAGDLAARLAMPLAAPLPPLPGDRAALYGVAEGHDDGYGRFLVSSGPYMLEGSEDLDFSREPATQIPVAGLVPGRSIVLVRNPSWEPDTDELRAANPDRIEFLIGGSIDDSLAALDAGAADIVWNPNPAPVYTPEQIGPYLAGPKSGRVILDDYDSSRGIFLNLALPPFNDIHVRRAANYALDKARLVELTGGAPAARVATHLVTDSLLDNLLADYDPYATPGQRGDVESARTEMRLSAYDSDGDGTCDSEACGHVRAVTRGGPYERIGEAVRDDLAAIGITVELAVLEQDAFFDSFYDPASRASMYVGLGLTKSFMSAASFFVEQFHSGVAVGPDFTNGTLVGASPELLEQWGYDPVDLPNIDERIDACVPLVGSAQFECWAGLDQYLMEELVPLVPYVFDRYPSIVSPRVVGYAFDQAWASPAWDRIAVSD